MKILISALEPSSNVHLKELLKHLPNVELRGTYDKNLGGENLYDVSDFSVMGFVDVFKKIRFFKKALKAMAQEALACDKVLLMDSSSFNIPLAEAIKKLDPQKEIIYYILPQVWAWKPWRAKKINALCDKLISIVPFDAAYYKNPNYVGHPLIDEISTFKDTLSASGKVAFLPGSRRSEIKRLMPIYRELRTRIDKQAVLSIPPFYADKIAEIYGDVSGFEVEHDTQKLLAESEFAFVCSGTATLECSLIGTPFILVYKARTFDYKIASLFVKLKYVGLANLILDDAGAGALHPELYQENCTVEKLLESYRTYDKEAFLQKVFKLRKILGQGCSKRAAEIISL